MKYYLIKGNLVDISCDSDALLYVLYNNMVNNDLVRFSNEYENLVRTIEVFIASPRFVFCSKDEAKLQDNTDYIEPDISIPYVETYDIFDMQGLADIRNYTFYIYQIYQSRTSYNCIAIRLDNSKFNALVRRKTIDEFLDNDI